MKISTSWPLILVLFISFNLFADSKTIRIRNIYIRSLDVFDASHPEFGSWFFQAGNRLHIKTRNSFIRKEILLREGDLLEDDLLRESERNLRRYNFLTEVSIQAFSVGENEADVFVNTEDQWTTKLNLSVGKARGYRTFEIGMEEGNFLGLGKNVGWSYERTRERETAGGYYQDPRFLNSRFRANMNLSRASDGYRSSFALTHPLYSQASRWTYGMNMDRSKRLQHFYFRTIDAAQILVRQQSTNLFMSRSWGQRYKKIRTGLIFGFSEVLFPEPARIADAEASSHDEVQRNLDPADNRLFHYGIDLGIDRQKYVRFQYVDKFGRIEDFPRGLLCGLTVARSENQNGPDYVTTALSARWAFAGSDSQYVVAFARAAIRRQTEGWNNLIADLFAHYYLRRSGPNLGLFQSPRQTFALSLASTLTNHIDAPFQLSLGENEGLRGYDFKSFTGLNRILLNFEDRIFAPWENRLGGFAFVPFTDVGYIWSSRNASKNLGASVGLGLRFGFKKYARTQIFRIDFAYPLVHASGISVAITTGQLFDVL